MARSILVVVAHPDDETLGCGATIARHAEAGDEVNVLTFTDGVSSRKGTTWEDASRRRTQMRQALLEMGVSHPECITWGDLEDQTLDTAGVLRLSEIVAKKLRQQVPDVVYTHDLNDGNQDHRAVAQAVMVATRPIPDRWSSSLPPSVLMFRIPEWRSWGGLAPYEPNNYMVVTKRHLGKKLAALACYTEERQRSPHPRSFEITSAWARCDGSSCGSDYAEAFQAYRIIE